MKHLTHLAALLVVALAPATVLGADVAAPAPAEADIDKAVAAIADYDLGRSRSPLWEVERIVNSTMAQADLRRHLERQLVQLLQSKAADECKLFVCEQLWAIGTDQSIGTLQRMLTDEKTSHMACLALRSNSGQAPGKALREAAGQAKGKALLCIIGALGDRRDEASVPLLGKLAGAEDPAPAEAAISALGRIASDEAAAILAKLRKTADPKMQDDATNAYLQCAAALADAGKTQQAAAIYRELLAEKEATLHRRAALAGLIEMGGADAVPLVLSTLAGSDRTLQATAIARVRTLKAQGVTERFVAELPRLSPGLQTLLIGVLEDRGDAAARPAIVAATASDSDEVRTAAARALGTLGDASSVPVLVRSAADGKSEPEKRAALMSLRRLRGDQIDAAIVASLKAAKGEVRAQLIDVLSNRAAVGAVPDLLKEAETGDANARRAALRALGQWATPDTLPKLLEILVAADADAVRPDAESAAVLVARKLPDEESRADAILAALRGGASSATKCSLIRVLRGIANAKAFEAAQAALKDPDAAVQDAAVRALADWPDGRAIGAVLGICRTTANQTHRIVAMRGCLRLLGLPGVAQTDQALKAYTDLMALARRPEEKRLVLAGLANVPHPGALALAESCLTDDAVSGEAALAAVKIARTIKGAHRRQAAAAMSKLAAAAKDPGIRAQAQEIVAQIEKFADFITAWQVCGPYTEEGTINTQLYDIPFGPEKPDAKDVEWHMLPAGTNPARPVVLDLAAALGGEQRVAYVRTWIHSDTAQDARLEIGQDDAVKVWLNGRLVHGKNTSGACIPGAAKADVSLRQRSNELLLKVVQATGPWEFCLRLCKRDGGRLEGIRVDSTPQP